MTRARKMLIGLESTSCYHLCVRILCIPDYQLLDLG